MMNRSSLFLRIALLTGLFHLSLHLPAQNGRYIIEQRYVQQLAWAGDAYVLKYEVVIERDEGAGYRVYSRELTELPRLQISLPPGNYRYRVIPFDFLEQPGDASNWINIDIKPAPIIPVEVKTIGEDNYALFPHDGSRLVPGVNEIIIKNPDELKTDEGLIIVEKQKAAELVEPADPGKKISAYLSAAWVPLFPVFGRMQQNVVGADFRLGIIYNKSKLLNPGLELSAIMYSFDSAYDEKTYWIQAGVIGFNFLAQSSLSGRRMVFTLRAGAGFAIQVDAGNLDLGYGNWYLTYSLVPQINLEYSFYWLARKQFFLEAGLGFTLLLEPSFCLRPCLGIGWLL
jgi:hypothetical protein